MLAFILYIHMAKKVTKAEAVADLERVAAELGHPPKLAEYREHGEYSAPTVSKHFEGSFTDARAEILGLDDSNGRMAEHRRGELLADLERVAEIVGGEPSKGDYKEHGEYALSTITYRFETWIDAKQEAGVYDGLDEGPTREELVEDLRRVDEEHDGPVSKVVYNERGEWSQRTVQRRFESWEAGCQVAGVTRPEMGPRTEETEAFLEDLRQLADELDRLPSRSEYHEQGKFSRGMAISRFGSWTEAVREAGYEPRKSGATPGDLNGNWTGGYEGYYGPTWNKQRRAARERDEYECAACGMTEGEHLDEYGWQLEVHHIVPFRKFDDSGEANALENLVTLCREHHRKYEHLPSERARKLLE